MRVRSRIVKVDFHQSEILHLIERRDTFASISMYSSRGCGCNNCIDLLIMDTINNLDIVPHSGRGKGVPSFDEMMNIALMEVDFDDPITNVRGRRALAIAKPTPRGYRPRRSTINLTTRVCFLRANEEQARN